MSEERSPDERLQSKGGREVVIGLVGWAVLVGLLAAWQGIGLVRMGDQFPTLSEVFRVATRHAVPRWLLLGFWLWVGWHLFVTRWQDFFRP